MVKICDSVYIHHNELSSKNDKPINYEQQFSEYPYELDHFQKYAVQAIEEGHHVLVTAHTGSGKSMPCEHVSENSVLLVKKLFIQVLLNLFLTKSSLNFLKISRIFIWNSNRRY